ncbi:MAG: hypothetical protein ACR2LV_02690 [Solirubrobacteraceae bacterium]
MKLEQCLAGVSAKHRSAVAGAVGLGKRASAQEIASALLDPPHLEALLALLARLSAPARGRAVAKVLRAGAQGYLYSPAGDSADLELERHGLAFGFRGGWRNEYAVPDDLRGPLLAALALAHVAAMKPARAERWIGAPLQLAHDAVAVWAALHREPARVKTDGDLYQRAWPKLDAALPRLDVYDAEDFLRQRRLEMALVVLRQEGALRVRHDDASGWETKRELVPTGSLRRTLESGDSELSARLVEHVVIGTLDAAGLSLLSAAAALDAVSLPSLGDALARFLEQAGERIDPRLSKVERGLLAVQVGWLAGRAEIGLSRDGKPVAVRSVERSEAREGDGSGAGPPGICQGNFEIVLLRHPTPAQRLTLELAGEAVAGQPHVYRITRSSVRVGERAGVGPDGVLAALRGVAGDVPQNVARSVADWAAGAGPPLRVRTAMMLDAGEPQLADALASGPLAELVVERIGNRLLAFRADRLGELRRALATAGRELEPGLDRISGQWDDRERRETDVQLAWAARPSAAAGPAGKLVSTLRSPAPVAVESARAGAEDARRDRDGDDPEDDRDGTIDVILDAIENEEEVFIVYAGARGVSRRCIRPLDVEGSQVRAICNDRGDEQRFWIGSIMAVAAVPG